MKPHRLMGILASCLYLSACGASAPQDTKTGGAPGANAQTHADDSTQANQGGTLEISDEIRRACGIDDATPYFAYNSAQLRDANHPVLAKLAQCFSSGPLKGRNMSLVGYADPRGDDEYNMLLGDRRAQQVGQYLSKRGLPSQQVRTSSRGSMDATGQDEASYARDRRVEVKLAN